VGYRWFDAHGEEPLFAFGHGLTYTEFRYGDLRARRDEDSGNHVVAVEVENAGERAGSEVVQLYVAMPPEADAPPRQLAGFRKLRLEPGERAEATFELTSRELAAYDEEDGRWVVRRGRYGLFAGASSRDIRAQAEVEVDRSRTV
jgi:beta-glucosidase